MSERTKRYDQSLETETVIGNFTLHLPTDPNLVPSESFARLASRKYAEGDFLIDPDLPIVREARLDLGKNEEGMPCIVGSIDFDTPTSYQTQPEGMIAYQIQRGLLDKFHKTLVGREIDIHPKGGFSVIERRRPTVDIEISHGDLLKSRLELKARLSPNQPKPERLQDIISVATQWVELQEMIVQLNDLPYRSRRQHDIYLDMGTESYVSDIELALMSIIGRYESLGTNTPEWDKENFIDSHTLAKMEQFLTTEKVQKSAEELVHSIHTFGQLTGHMEPLSERVIAKALNKALRSPKHRR